MYRLFDAAYTRIVCGVCDWIPKNKILDTGFTLSFNVASSLFLEKKEEEEEEEKL